MLYRQTISIDISADDIKGTSTVNFQFNIINISINHFIKTFLSLESNHIFTTYLLNILKLYIRVKKNSRHLSSPVWNLSELRLSSPLFKIL